MIEIASASGKGGDPSVDALQTGAAVCCTFPLKSSCARHRAGDEVRQGAGSNLFDYFTLCKIEKRKVDFERPAPDETEESPQEEHASWMGSPASPGICEIFSTIQVNTGNTVFVDKHFIERTGIGQCKGYAAVKKRACPLCFLRSPFAPQVSLKLVVGNLSWEVTS